MFGFKTSQPEPPSPAATEIVVALPAPCCEHCRLRPRKTYHDLAGTLTGSGSFRIRFDDAFEAKGVQLRRAAREADARLGTLAGTVSRLQLALHAVWDQSAWDRRADPDALAGRGRATQHDLAIAQRQLAYATASTRKAHLALSEHTRERQRREHALAQQRIVERDRRRAAEREAAGLPPPQAETETFVISAEAIAAIAAIGSRWPSAAAVTR